MQQESIAGRSSRVRTELFLSESLCIVQGVLPSDLRPRGDVIRGLHVAVKSVAAAGREIEAWRLQSSIPAEEQLYLAVQAEDANVLPELKAS